MLKKNIKYIDYDGIERDEDFYFNLSKAELMEMQTSMEGGFKAYLEKIVKALNVKEIMKVMTEIILKAYGVKSEDGKRFIKIDKLGRPLSIDFSQTEAYSNLFMELATDDKAAAEFINGIIPADIAKEIANNPELSKQLELK